MSTEARFCGNCGATLRPGSRFCTSCGQVTAAAAPSPSEQSPPLQQPSRTAAYEDTVIIPPPEAFSPTAPLTPPEEPARIASLASRFVAVLIDSLAFIGVFWLIGSLVANTTDDTTEYGFNLEGSPAIVVLLLSMAVYFLYYILLEGITGATLGKMVMGIRVERTNGGPAGFAAAAVRNVLRIVDGLFGYLVGLIVALTSRLRQRIGDRAAGTVVVNWPQRSGARIGALITALALAVLGTGAGIALRDPAAPAAASVTATLARNVTPDHQAVDPTTRFAPTTDVFYLAFQVTGAEPGTEVRSVWYAVDVGNAAPPNTVIDEASLTLPGGSESGNFRLRRGPNPWPVGDYKVELYLDGELVQTLPFTVAR